MSEHEEFYTPEHVDEQVDALLQAREMSLRDQRMASDLQSMLQHTDEDASSLQRVLQKLMEQDRPVQQQGKIIPFAELHAQQQRQGRFAVMHETQKQAPLAHRIHPILRPLSALAAVLVVAVVVGSMLFTLNAIHQKQASTPGTHTGAAVEHEGQLIYQSPEGSHAAWSPDGSRIAVFTTTTAVNTNGITTTTVGVESWDARTGQHVLKYPTDGDPGVNIAWSPDGTELAVASETKIYLFDAKTTQLLRAFPRPAVALNGNATPSFAATSMTKSAAPLSRQLPLSGAISPAFENVVWSPDGKKLAAALNASDGSLHVVYVWDAQTGSVLQTLPNFQGTILNVSWSPNGQWLSTVANPAERGAGMTPVATLWDTTTWQIVKQYPNVAIAGLAWSPDGKHLALVDAWGGDMGGNGKDVRIVNVLTGQTTVKPFGGSQNTIIFGISWSPDGSRLALDQQVENPSIGTQVTLWSTTSGTQLYSFATSYDATWSPDGKYISTTEGTGSGGVYTAVWVA